MSVRSLVSGQISTHSKMDAIKKHLYANRVKVSSAKFRGRCAKRTPLLHYARGVVMMHLCNWTTIMNRVNSEPTCV